MKKFLLITYYWPPAGGAGVQRWLGFSKHLPANGWEPIILTVHPEHATYPQRDDTLLAQVPDGLQVVRTKSIEPLQWYGRLAGKDRVPYGGFSNEKTNSWTSKFIRGNFFIPDARRGWNCYALSAARKLIKELNIDLVLTTGPPHSTHLIGLELKHKLKVNWIADMRDPWTEVYYNFDMPRTSLAVRYDRLLERRVLTRADAVITASPGFARQFNTMVDRAYDVVTNGYDALLPRVEKSEDSAFYITYTGTIAESYHPEAVLTALSQLLHLNFRLRFAGNVAPAVLDLIEKHGLKPKLDFLGYLSHGEAIAELTKSDLLLLLTPVVRDGGDIIPGKMFEYLSASAPILALAPVGSALGSILDQTRSGQSFMHDDVEGIKAYLSKVMAHPQKRDRGAEILAYKRVNLAGKLANIFDRLQKESKT